MGGGVLGKEYMWEVVGPIQLLGRRLVTQQCMQSPIEPLALTVPLRMIRGGASVCRRDCKAAGSADSQSSVLDQSVFKLALRTCRTIPGPAPLPLWELVDPWWVQPV